MKFGVNLINFGPGANPESLTRSVNLVEAIGYHLIMSSDHIAVTPDVSSRYPAPFYEPLTTMGWLAATTQSMEIGTTVAILPYRSPLEIARAWANVDQLSGGRFILGVGVGWAEQEFDALNVPFRQRGAIIYDYLAAIKALWTQDVASYEGRYVSFTDVDTAARPVREPHPPVWVRGCRRRRTPPDGALRRRLAPDQDTRVRFQGQEDSSPARDGGPRADAYTRALSEDTPAHHRVAHARRPAYRRRRQPRPDQALGCTHVLLDTYYYDVEATTHHETAWRMLATVDEKAADLRNETVR